MFCHKCGKSICDFAQSRWMRISSYFNYHVVFPNDPLILLDMLFIGHGLRCVCVHTRPMKNSSYLEISSYIKGKNSTKCKMDEGNRQKRKLSLGASI